MKEEELKAQKISFKIEALLNYLRNNMDPKIIKGMKLPEEGATILDKDGKKPDPDA